MNFEELQVIWNSQSNENMYTINESTLHNYIKRKGKSINYKVNIQEFVLIGVNLFAGIELVIGALVAGIRSPQSILAVFYLAFAVYGLVRRLGRRKKEKPFDHTMLGELDKAIWQIDYLMQQGQNIIIWYMLPLTLIFGVMSIFTVRLFKAFELFLLLTPVTYLVHRWEFKKLHLPKKHNLELLREKLTTQENH